MITVSQGGQAKQAPSKQLRREASTVVMQNCSATATKEQASKAKQSKDLTFQDFLLTKLQVSNSSGSNNHFLKIKKIYPFLNSFLSTHDLITMLLN